MDPLVLAAGTALVGAMAKDGWDQTRAAVVALWRRARPTEGDDIHAGLTRARSQLLVAREGADEDIFTALVGSWQLRLQQLLDEDPGIMDELQWLLDNELSPSLGPEERNHIRSIVQKAEGTGNSRIIQAGRDVRFAEPPEQ
ncbi:hypothetical protein ACTPOK_38345 [Streptomyces inhibens]|uniref:hypothetical protein n=1 Tax=Streptomyces inhibens TaxID=2293571 RepID=UPI00402AAB9E